jgi:hypothetical protein
MIMRFLGGGVGHTSTRAETNVFKADRDVLDMKSHPSHQERAGLPLTEPSNVEEERDDEMDNIIVTEDSEAEIEPDEDGELSESELVDYGYELEGESDLDSEEDEDGESGEDSDMMIDEPDVLGYADY